MQERQDYRGVDTKVRPSQRSSGWWLANMLSNNPPSQPTLADVLSLFQLICLHWFGVNPVWLNHGFRVYE